MRQCLVACVRQQAPLLGLVTMAGFLTALIASGGNVLVAIGGSGLVLGAVSLFVASLCLATCIDQHSA